MAGGSTTQFVHDQAGHLIAESNGSGVVQKEYIWLDDMPVAMVDSTGTSPVLYFIHTDQLGTPQKITDGSMNVVWDGVFDPFGNPASGASLALTNLRFPGQYYDAEGALHQNWNRDYDSQTGRYIQSDPLGLYDGMNTYVYAENSPLGWIDWEGLATQVTVWNPVGYGESSFGHASSSVNGSNYSFGPNGMDRRSQEDYYKRQDFRGGFEYDLNLSPEQEAKYGRCLSSQKSSYNFLHNNCTSPILRCLNEAGVTMPQTITPRGLGMSLWRSPQLKGYRYIPRPMSVEPRQ